MFHQIASTSISSSHVIPLLQDYEKKIFIQVIHNLLEKESQWEVNSHTTSYLLTFFTSELITSH